MTSPIEVVTVIERVQDHLLRERRSLTGQPAQRGAIQYALDLLETERQRAMAAKDPSP